jgi:acyl-CoA hydrolase
MSGRVIWTGHSSMDIQMELTQGGAASHMEALFTFVARHVGGGGAPHPVNPLRPGSKPDQELFCRRQRVADARKAARQRAKEAGQQCGCLLPPRRRRR